MLGLEQILVIAFNFTLKCWLILVPIRTVSEQAGEGILWHCVVNMRT